MKQLPSSGRGRLRRQAEGRSLFLVFLAFVVSGVSLWLVCDGRSYSVSGDDGVKGYLEGDGGSEYGLRPGDVCSGSGSGSFCFPSTLLGVLAGEDGSWGEPVLEGLRGSAQREENAYFKMSNGGVVTCSLVDAMGGDWERFHFRNRSNDAESIENCKGPIVPDDWIQASSGLDDTDGHSKESRTGLLDGSSMPNIEIYPPLLDWGEKSLYSPSLAFLNVVNGYNDCVLHVYQPFSTNAQFYAYNFDNVSLAPGESASIAFVFLPRWLGLSSAQLILQTSHGGFIIHAKGIAIESPFRIDPLVRSTISPDEGLTRKLSLYNPFNDVLYVEEASMWISVSSGNISSSSGVICSTHAMHQSTDEFGSYLSDENWFSTKNGVDFRPQKWEVPPYSSETVVELNLWPYLEGNIFGALCLQLSDSIRDRTDIIIVPFEVEVHGRETYSDITGSISVYFESLLPLNGRVSTCSISLKNEASYLLTVTKISEVTESSRLFQIKYTEGLLLFPGTLTQIALFSYNPMQSATPELPNVNSDCMLIIMTNASASQQIQIPCQDVVRSCSLFQLGSDFVQSAGSYIRLVSEQDKLNIANARTGSLKSIVEEPSAIKPILMELGEADEGILRNWRSQATMSKMSVLKDRELLFPVVQIGTHLSKWITVHNPSPKPVIMQLVLNSGALIDQCKSDYNASDYYTFSSRVAYLDSMKIRVGFSVADSGVTEAFVHPSGTALFGPIIFRPSNRCMWRSSALIRNNLSGVEWLPLQAFGGSHSLVLLEGSEPVRKLQFNFDFPMAPNTSSQVLLSHIATTNDSCNHLLSKEVVAKNTGELPLEVMRLEVSGTKCGLDGFRIQTCEGFALAPGESMRLLISYQADFSAAVVHRDLELAMASGILVIPMRACLPDYLLKLCRKSFIWAVHLKLFLLVSALVSILVVFRVIPHAFSSGNEGCFVKGDNTIATIRSAVKSSGFQHNTTNSRSYREDGKSGAVIVDGHANRPIVRENTKRLQGGQYVDDQKKTSLSPTTKPTEVFDSSDISEAAQDGNLTVRIAKERGGRRRRRANRGLTTKFEVSSSQSGNSTPSSPLSPSALAPKQIWPLSPDNDDYPFSRASERNQEKHKHDVEVPSEARLPELEKPVTRGALIERSLLPCATFPGPNCRSPGVVGTNFLASTSPIAPHARAPGSKLGKDKATKREESDVVRQEFTYDIWGNHFPDHILGRSKEFTSKLFDASEGDSESFFARGPQSLMMMSSAQSVSPGSETRRRLPTSLLWLYVVDIFSVLVTITTGSFCLIYGIQLQADNSSLRFF